MLLTMQHAACLHCAFASGVLRPSSGSASGSGLRGPSCLAPLGDDVDGHAMQAPVTPQTPLPAWSRGTPRGTPQGTPWATPMGQPMGSPLPHSTRSCSLTSHPPSLEDEDEADGSSWGSSCFLLGHDQEKEGTEDQHSQRTKGGKDVAHQQGSKPAAKVTKPGAKAQGRKSPSDVGAGQSQDPAFDTDACVALIEELEMAVSTWEKVFASVMVARQEADQVGRYGL